MIKGKKDINNCIYFLLAEDIIAENETCVYVEDRADCLHPDRNGECEYFNADDCKFFEEEL